MVKLLPVQVAPRRLANHNHKQQHLASPLLLVLLLVSVFASSFVNTRHLQDLLLQWTTTTTKPINNHNNESATESHAGQLDADNAESKPTLLSSSSSSSSKSTTVITTTTTMQLEMSLAAKDTTSTSTTHTPTIAASLTTSQQESAPQDVTVVLANQHPIQEHELICSPWDVDMDSWWQMHPDWEPHGENLTHTCFRLIPNPKKAQYLRKVYENQYHHGKGCGQQLRTRMIIGTGYAAVVARLVAGFWSALQDGVPFESNKHREGFRWMYVPPPGGTPGLLERNNSWADCPSGDHKCYFLPLSNCNPEAGRAESPVRWKQGRDPDAYAWLEGYLTRPRQHVRQRLFELMEKEGPKVPPGTDCTWIHVRRGDAQMERGHPRNFHTLSEYLEKGNVAQGETVVLLTDDETALEEAQYLHPQQYNWLYFNRTRHRGVAGLNDHFPSNDPAQEMLYILAEVELAGRCSKGVHGTSNLVQVFKNSMIRQHDDGGFQSIQLTKVDNPGQEERVRASDFMNDLEAKLKTAREAHKASPSTTN